MRTRGPTRRVLAWLLALAMCVSMVPGTALATGEGETIAEWSYTAAPEGGLPATATAGSSANASLSIFGATYHDYGSGGLKTDGWQENGYWLISNLNTSAYSNLLFSAKMRSSKTGPANFQLEYSTDGTNWTEVTGGTVKITSTSMSPLFASLALPEEAISENLSLRIRMTDSTSLNGKTVESGGANNINNIVITGTPAGGTTEPETKVSTPTATPGTGSTVEPGSTVTLSCSTPDAKILYNTIATDAEGSQWQTYSAPIVIPADVGNTYTLYVQATKDGLDPSDVITVTYKALKLVTIAEAKELENNAIAKVSGTVIFVDGRNVVVQDDTGGINLYFASAPTDIAVGNSVTAVGTRGAYNGLEQLTGVKEYTVSADSAELPSAEKTIAEIIADQTAGELESTRVHITGAVIGAINTSGNTVLTQGDSTINIYKAPALNAVTEGDTMNLYAVVSDFKGYQLRVIKAEDVTVTSQAPLSALTPEAEGTTAAGETLTFSLPREVEGVTWQVTLDGGESVTLEGNSYTIPDDLSKGQHTLAVQAAKDGETSKTLTLTWEVTGGDQPVTTVTGTLTNTLTHGDQVVIYYPKETLAVTGTASGSKLTGVEATVADTTLTAPLDAAVFTVHVDTAGNLSFVSADGKYLTSGKTGSSLTLADAASEYSLWTLETATGGFYIKNVNAKYNNSTPQYIEYFSGFTTFSFRSSNVDIYTYQFYKTGHIDLPAPAVDYPTDASVVESIAAWGGGMSAYEDGVTVGYGDKYTALDKLDTNAEFTAFDGSGKQLPIMTTGTGNHYMGASSLTSSGYMQFAVSTVGWGDMKLSFRMRVTGASAADYQLQYSTDNGQSFESFTTGTYAYSYAIYGSDGGTTNYNKDGKIANGIAEAGMGFQQNSANYVSFTFDVPTGAENAENLLIRLVAGDKRTSGDGAVTGGNIRIDSVVLSGSPIVDGGITGYVSVTPDGVEEDQAPGTELTMTSATEGAEIQYSFNGTNWQTYDAANKPTLPKTLPANLEVYATSTGKADSVKRIFTYAAGTVSAVKMSPNGGGVYLAQDSDTVEVVLSCDTQGAQIYYSDTAEEEYKLYTAPIVLARGFGEKTIKAYAVKDGFTASAVTTRTFTERSQAEYDLYFGQLHSHTAYSDGAGTCEEAFKHAKGLDEAWNIDFLAVTDHSNSFDNADAASIKDGSMSEEWKEGHQLAKSATGDGFVGIYGFEMTWSNGLGHINTFNTDGFQSRTQTEYKTYNTALQNYYATLKTVSDSLSQFNHPGTTFGDFSDFAHYDEEIDDLITLIEVGNGEGAIGSSGYFPSYEYYTRALDKGWHVAPSNNQDNHKGNWGDSNTGRTVVLTDSLTEEAIYDAIRNYRVYATEDLNLEIRYTLDGNVMGTILDGAAGDNVSIQVGLSDQDDTGSAKVEVIVNGGLSVDSKTVTCNETVDFQVPATYSYYYIKVTQADGDIAVTAPVWIGKVEAVGISSLAAGSDLTVAGEEQTFTLELFNNENKPLSVTSITLTDKTTGEVLGTDTTVASVPKLGTASCQFNHTFAKDGIVTVTATVRGTLNGVEKTYTQDLELTVMPSEIVSKIVVDGSHYNDYVTGYYGGNMGNMTTIAADAGVKVEIVREKFTADTLKDCSLLVISAPAKKTGTANAGDFVPSSFEDDFIQLVADYVENGGSIVVCGLADYQDKSGHSAEQLNKLLDAIGSTMRINDDEVIDEVNNGGQPYRLYPAVFNMESSWTAGIQDGQTYSQYSGCSVDPGSGTWLVKGFETTWGADSDKDGVGVISGLQYSYESESTTYTYNVTVDKGQVVFLACEDTQYGGTVFAAGGVFLSDFEVKAELDNIWDLPYANRTIYENILGVQCATDEVTPIADVRKAELNRVFVVEGYVTNGTANPNTTFFDAIYIQDETGGTTVFPYAAEGLAIGTKVRVIGYTDAYQDDREIQVLSLKVLEDAPKVYAPKTLSTKDAMDYAAYGGQLIGTSGTVSDIIQSNGVVSQFKLTDSTGVAATVFIDGYITNPNGQNTVGSWIQNGQTVSAVGLLYTHPEGSSDVSVPVLRVRNCDEITQVGSGTPIIPVYPVTPTTPAQPDQPVTPVYRYVDVADTAWYAEYVAYVSEKGLMTGTSATTFAPDATTTRAMIWTVLGRMSGTEVDGGEPWYALAQTWAMANGVSDGTNPNSAITREQLAAMLYRFAGEPDLLDSQLAALNTYADSADVSDWAQEAMAWAVSSGIINGIDGKLAPKANATRAQVAAMLKRYCVNAVK